MFLYNGNVTNDLIMIEVSFPIDFNCRLICEHIIQTKLAFCIHELPEIKSYYEWEGKTQYSSEYLLHIKTTSDKFSDIETYIKENHPYDTPEIISFKVDDVNSDYLNWAISN